MIKPPSFDGEIERARVALDDTMKAMDAAEGAISRHAKGDVRLDTINFPIEEDTVTETLAVLGRWKALAVSLVKQLDQATATADLHYQRLFDDNAGRESASLLNRKITLGRVPPAAIASDLEAILIASAEVDALLKAARPALVRHHRSCEEHIDRIIEKRQRFDYDIEEAQRRSDALMPKIADRRNSLLSGRDPEALAAVRDEHEILVAERDMFRDRERALQPPREALQRLIDIYEELVDAQNGQIAAVNAMMGKSAVDIEQRIALLKGVASEAVPPLPVTQRPAAVAALFTAFEANILAGHDLAARKARADDIFSRRLQPHSPATSAPKIEEQTAAEPEV